MNPKTKAKIAVDIAMSILFLLLMYTTFTGILLHEALGVLVAGLFAAHLLLNRQWFKGIARRIRKPGGWKALGTAALNTLIGLGAATTIVSGVLISQYLFVPLAVDDTSFWSPVHAVSAWATLGLVSLHAVLHWRWVAGILRHLAAKAGQVKATVVRIGVGLMAAATVFSLFSASPLELLSATASGSAQTETIQSSKSNSQAAVSAGGTGNTTAISGSSGTDTEITLQEYLSKFICTGCHRRCLLSNPQCGRGQQQAEVKAEVYQETYANG